MSARFDAAVAEVRLRRERLLKTLDDVKDRTTPAQLADDALAALDPQLTWLMRVKERMARNKLLSLAVLAGAGWLAGLPRHLDGKPPAARNAGSTEQRVNPKEKKNDSGQHKRNQRPVSGTGQRNQVPRPKGFAQAQQHRAQLGGSEARPGDGVAPRLITPRGLAVGAVGREPQQQQPEVGPLRRVGRQRKPLVDDVVTEP